MMSSFCLAKTDVFPMRIGKQPKSFLIHYINNVILQNKLCKDEIYELIMLSYIKIIQIYLGAFLLKIDGDI